MPSIAKQALQEARRLGLDLWVSKDMVPTAPFVFECLEPRESMVEAFEDVRKKGAQWIPGMPIPVLVYYPRENDFRIMDGMMRICAAQKAGLRFIPAFIASGETYDVLEPILNRGYYGEDFVEMLSMVNPAVRNNLRLRDRNRLAGIR